MRQVQQGPGGGWHVSGAGDASPAAASQDKKKLRLWLALGCGGLLFVGSLVGGLAIYLAVDEPTEAGLEDLPPEFTRGMTEDSRAQKLVPILEGIHVACAGDPSGEAARPYFHPDVFADLKDQVCQVDGGVVQGFGGDSASAQGLDGAPDEARATSLGLHPAQCIRYTYGEAKIIGCRIDGFKIIDMSGFESLGGSASRPAGKPQ